MIGRPVPALALGALLVLLVGAALVDLLGLALLSCGLGALLAAFARADPVAGKSTLVTGGFVLGVGLVGIAGALTDWPFGDVAWMLVGGAVVYAVSGAVVLFAGRLGTVPLAGLLVPATLVPVLWVADVGAGAVALVLAVLPAFGYATVRERPGTVALLGVTAVLAVLAGLVTYRDPTSAYGAATSIFVVGMYVAIAVLWVPLHLAGVAAGRVRGTRSA